MREKTTILKGLAILGVIFIHVNSNLFNFFVDETPAKNFLIAFDQLIRFSVPLFVFLSGLALGLKYKDERIVFADFFKRRVLKLLPLYFLWSAIIFLIFPKNFPPWEIILLGRAEYHLYFVPMIFQLYLLFPLFLWFIRKKPLLLMSASFVFQLFLLWKFTHGLNWDDQHQYVFFGSWVFYFVMGIYIANKNLLEKINRPTKIALLLLTLATGFWVITDAFNLQSLRENIIVVTRSSKISVYFYSIFFILTTQILSMSKFNKLLTFLGKNSYLIYLSHTLVIKVVFEPFFNKKYDPFWMASVLIIVALGWKLSMLRWSHGQNVPNQTGL